VAVTYRTSATGGSSTGTSNRTAVITPAVGDLFVVFVCVAANNNDVPTVTDNNGSGTYDRIWVVPITISAINYRLSCHVRTAKLANTTSTTVTANTGSNTSGSVVVVALAGSPNAGAAAVRQSATQSDQAAGTPAPAFSSAALTGNLTLGAVGNGTNPATMTTPSGWTERQDVGQASDAHGLEVVSRDSGFTGTTVTWGSSSASRFASGILELESALIISGAGNVATGEAFGTAVEGQTAAPGGVASGEAFGTAVERQWIDVSAVASAETHGSHTVELAGPAGDFIDPGGVASLEAFGAATEQQHVLASGIAGGELLGTATMRLTINASGVATAEALGAPVELQTITASGVATGEAHGSSSLLRTIGATAIAGGELFGSPALASAVLVTGIAPGAAFGNASMLPILLIDPSGIASLGAFGATSLHAAIIANGITTGESIGTPRLELELRPSAVGSAEVFGSPQVVRLIRIDANAIASGETAGAPTVELTDAGIRPIGIATAEGFGAVTVLGGAQVVEPPPWHHFGWYPDVGTGSYRLRRERNP
jgi:hypothetical protein